MLPSETGPKLHLLVYTAARELCRVELPLTAVDNIENMFPDEDRRRVLALGVDFAAAIARAKSSGFARQTLIDANTSERSYRIWIE